MQDLYGIDMEKEGQFPKKLEDLPTVDMVVTMGCESHCPVLPGVKTLAWEIPDPAGRPDPEFRSIMEVIRSQVLYLGTEKSRQNDGSNDQASARSSQYLSLWVFSLCMAAGVLVGHFLPAVPRFLDRLQIDGISIPIAI